MRRRKAGWKPALRSGAASGSERRFSIGFGRASIGQRTRPVRTRKFSFIAQSKPVGNRRSGAWRPLVRSADFQSALVRRVSADERGHCELGSLLSSPKPSPLSRPWIDHALTARLTAEQVAWVLNCQLHDWLALAIHPHEELVRTERHANKLDFEVFTPAAGLDRNSQVCFHKHIIRTDLKRSPVQALPFNKHCWA